MKLRQSIFVFVFVCFCIVNYPHSFLFLILVLDPEGIWDRSAPWVFLHSTNLTHVSPTFAEGRGSFFKFRKALSECLEKYGLNCNLSHQEGQMEAWSPSTWTQAELGPGGCGAFLTSHMCFDSTFNLKQLSGKNKVLLFPRALVADLERVVFVK